MADLLRDLWAIGTWVERDPTCTDADSWGPVRDLLADVEHTGWLDVLCTEPAVS